jgi:ribosomal protein L13
MANSEPQPGPMKMKTLRIVVFCLLVAAPDIAPIGAAPGLASELTFQNTAIEKMLMDELFIDKGRYHLLKQTACQYAYLDSPAVTLSEGRVRIRVRLSGKLAVEVADQCVGGAGDVVNVVVSGRPVFSGENIALTDVKVDEVSKEAYRLLLTQFVESAIPRAVEINVREGLQRMLATRQSTYEVAVNQLSVVDLTAENNQLHATLTFSLTAR